MINTQKVLKWFERFEIIEQNGKFSVKRLKDGTFWSQKFNSYESAKTTIDNNIFLPHDKDNFEKMKIAKQIKNG